MLIEDDYDMTIKDSSTVVKSVVEASSELEGEDHTKRKILDSCYVPVTVPGGYYGSSCKLLRVITERQSVNGERSDEPTRRALLLRDSLAPLYQQLAKIDFAPRYLWSRLSLPNYDAAKAPHNDALLVTRYLEDFKMVDRYKGASFEDAKMVVHALAWFPCHGHRDQHKRPDVYQQIQENFGFPIHLEKSGEARRDNVESMIDEAFRNETMSQIDIEPGTAEWLKETQKDSSRLECCYPRAQRTDEEADELSCLCHNDLWANNVMIRISHQQPQQCGESEEEYNSIMFNSMKIAKYNRYNDVRFVDWQTYYVSSPLTELVFFIFVTLELPLDAKKIDDLLAMYRETLICVTYDRYNIDLSRSLSDSNRFFERLRRDARDELYHIVKFVKIASLVENEDPFDPIVDPETIDRLRSIFKIYREKKWLKETPREVGARGQDPYLRHVRQNSRRRAISELTSTRCTIVADIRATSAESNSKQMSYLRKHVDAVHNRIATYPCDACSRRFSTKDHLKIHVDSVHDRVTYACDLCAKSFSSKGYLRIHSDSVHLSVNFECEIRERKFPQKNKLKTHMDAEHNGVTYKCY
ncbi:unnamed protein product [Trichogramma brassicae]|uniref:C2H2-type domain-containing protein n=1 Tax=Trichogramma brassicae TaxID=86971 RepID=A0A6H5HVE6_9HYME|nr:unnamed protein product [Trichogramma brassicae]